MKSIKLILALSLTLILSIGLVGCGNKNTTSSTTENSSKEEKKNQNVDNKDQTSPIPSNVLNLKLKDQYGNTYTLASLKGKTVFLNFFASWCGPCKSELKEIEELYKSRGENKKDVLVLGIAYPTTEDNKNAADASQEEILDVVKNYGVTYPILFDTTGQIFNEFGIRSFPTTFTITNKNEILGYKNGAMGINEMNELVDITLATSKN